MLSLDARHTTHNIPGKFLSYMEAGLPVLASVNAGNDLVKLIDENKVGAVITNQSSHNLFKSAEKLCTEINQDTKIHLRSKNLYKKLFSSVTAVNQIKKHF